MSICSSCRSMYFVHVFEAASEIPKPRRAANLFRYTRQLSNALMPGGRNHRINGEGDFLFPSVQKEGKMP
jgi:hypothetical protein